MKKSLLLVALLVLLACSGSNMAAGYAQVQTGMSVRDVKRLLGEPAEIERSAVTSTDLNILIYKNQGFTYRIICDGDLVIRKSPLVP
jgi:hypothetical protein